MSGCCFGEFEDILRTIMLKNKNQKHFSISLRFISKVSFSDLAATGSKIDLKNRNLEIPIRYELKIGLQIKCCKEISL